MNETFSRESFLLDGHRARRLYHEYAERMPLYDYHSHLPVELLAENRPFTSITEAWLASDHYKWRAMRWNGVDERLITGEGSDWDKFRAWAETVPRTLRNPLYHWTHLELQDCFGIHGTLLNSHTARAVYERCNSLLAGENFRPRALLERMKVRVLCTTNDPAESLEHHRKLRQDPAFQLSVVPSFRPDRALAVHDPAAFTQWVSELENRSGVEVRDFDSFLTALQKRHELFHDAGCRISDHALEDPGPESYEETEIEGIFSTIRSGVAPDPSSARKFRTCMLTHFARMNSRRGWAMLLHLGALRNLNTRRFQELGPDSGYDAMGDRPLARRLSAFLDHLEGQEVLPKTVLFNIDPRHNNLFVSIAGCFQEGPVPGRIQFGPAWWFNDSREGMIDQLNALSSGGLLSRFVGMVTDSRSFLSFPRHDYFRRVLCSLLGQDMARGIIPEDWELVGGMVEDICFRNAERYFCIPDAE